VQDAERRDIVEILEDRYGVRSTIITSQLPPAQWHDYLSDAALADAICDRLLHNPHRIVLDLAEKGGQARADRRPSVASLRSRSTDLADHDRPT
jgi:DNA replication protein DnaC